MSGAGRPFSARPAIGVAGLLAALVALLAIASVASAATYQRPAVEVFGSAVKPTLSRPAIIAVDPRTEDVLVGTQGSEESQAVTVDATGGTFELTLEGKSTSSLPFNAPVAQVEAAIKEAFAGSLAAEVTVNGGQSGLYYLSYGYRDVGLLGCVDGSPPLSGGTGCTTALNTPFGQRGLFRFQSDGTPVPFGALNSDFIDGERGPGGQECAKEPASCDETPQNYLEVDGGVTQGIAVDPVTGDIYITQGGPNGGNIHNPNMFVYIFSPEGEYLGQLDSSIEGAMEKPCGLAIDSSGAVYVAGVFGKKTGVAKYEPTAGPATNADNTNFFPIPGNYGSVCHMAVGAGPSAGKIFLGNQNGGNHVILVMDTETGEGHVFAEGFAGLVAVDPTTGNPLAENNGTRSEIAEFDGSAEVAGDPLSRLILEGYAFNRLSDMVASAAGEIYTVVAGESQIHVYGAPAIVPAVTLEPATEVTGTTATVSGTVNPEGTDISKCVFVYSTGGSTGEAACESDGPIPNGSDPYPVHAHLEGLAPNGKTYALRLAATNENGTARSVGRSFTTLYKAATEPAQATGTGTATLNGTLRPEGKSFTTCSFEYGIVTNPGYEESAPCDPPAADIPADFAPHGVSANVEGLQEGTSYRFRILAGNTEESLEGKELTFETFGSPTITEPGSRDAGQSAATLEAKVDPRGFKTSYYFEWGTSASYGKRAPAAPASAGQGQEPVRVTAALSGLAGGATYHFRVVAESRGERFESADQTVETLNSCGLAEGRCYELVSPRDAGPVAIPGVTVAGKELHFQAAEPAGGLAYVVETGFPDSTKSPEVMYRAIRGPSGWSSTQLSAPITARSERTDVNAFNGQTLAIAPDLACTVVESYQPLTDDPAMRLAYEYGGANLYRTNPDGSYTPITKLAPENFSIKATFNFVGISSDCSKAVFWTKYAYPGVAADPGYTWYLYEWDEGTLRPFAYVPTSSGEAIVEGSVPKGPNVVSESGSRVFFTATRQASPNFEEIGHGGVFAREDGTSSRDISLSETLTPDTGATFEGATPDGNHVFFSANAGLAENGASSAGNDLYEYSFEKPASERLTDLSIDHHPEGPKLTGFLDSSQDGSHVYFIAQGQMRTGRGNTTAQNESGNTYSIYGVAGGKVSFVGTVPTNKPTAQASPDGRYLLFESSADVTGYQSGGANEAYLYDADGGGEGTVVCVSCRPDGQPSVTPPGDDVLASGTGKAQNSLHPPQILSGAPGAPRAVFLSKDVLAPHAVEGYPNLYEWSHGQVFLLAAEALGRGDGQVLFAGASEDATDLYFTTPQTLTWEDGDTRNSMYDARRGGGFAKPAAPEAPCDPNSEGSCQRASQAPTAAPGAASAGFSGPGNVKPKSHRKHKKQKHKRHHKKHGKHQRHQKSHGKRHGKKKGSQQKKREQAGHARTANSDRRAGK